MRRPFLLFGIPLFLAGLLRPPLLQARRAEMPEFEGITQWLNTQEPLTRGELKGRVVLIDFWTYSCVNCIRTMPHVKSWYEKYHDKGLEIVGIHTPEFRFEKDPRNVQAAIDRHRLPFPVAMDNDYKMWSAYSNRYWPAHYLADPSGSVVFQQFGEGNYDKMESKIRELLGLKGPAAEGTAPREGADLAKPHTPEIYLGYERLSKIGNREGVSRGKTQTFLEPKDIKADTFYLVGDWRIEKEFARLMSPEGKILVRYTSNKANMVLDTENGQEVPVDVYVDGKPATDANRGIDDRISDSRLYNFTRTAHGEHVLELRFKRPGVRAYTFTFG
ncbi:MAG: thioredoxin family protein [Elusimicrobia bacterium]|nr:thioredoxin family protein [Elusimicrobiota bacterium]